MATPQVQDLSQILSELEPAFSQTRDLYNKQLGGVGGQLQSQKMALDAQKTRSFNNINDQMAARGVSFGGIPAHEQADYLSMEYLPGMQRIEEGANQRRDALSMALAQLEREKYTTGLGTQQRQQDTLNQYLEAERQRQAQLFLQQERQKFEASQNQLNRAHSSAQSSQKLTPGQMRQGAITFLDSVKGRDGHVSPARWYQARQLWVDEGGDPAVFDRDFINYVNRSHSWDYGIGTRPANNTTNSQVSNMSQLRF